MSIFCIIDDKHVPLYRVLWVSATPHFCGEAECQCEGLHEVALEGGEGYRLQVWLCAEGCRRLGWEWPAEKPVRFPLPEALEEGKRLVLVLFREGGLALRPAFLLEEEVGR